MSKIFPLFFRRYARINHVVRMANQALDNVRKSLKANMTAKERRTLMRERYILLKRKHDLNERDAFLLGTWLGNIPELKEAHELKEEFYWIWDTANPDEGKDCYRYWRKRYLSSKSKDPYKDLVRAVDNWQELMRCRRILFRKVQQ